MKINVYLNEAQAAAIRSNRANMGCSCRNLPDSLSNARQSTLASPLEIVVGAVRGQRRAATMIPVNMWSSFKESEDQAWNHSDVAGVLFENGLSASRAIALAEA